MTTLLFLIVLFTTSILVDQKNKKNKLDLGVTAIWHRGSKPRRVTLPDLSVLSCVIFVFSCLIVCLIVSVFVLGQIPMMGGCAGVHGLFISLSRSLGLSGSFSVSGLSLCLYVSLPLSLSVFSVCLSLSVFSVPLCLSPSCVFLCLSPPLSASMFLSLPLISLYLCSYLSLSVSIPPSN